jgi:hypothetical protein
MILPVFLAIGASACTETTGTQITQAQASQFTPGTSTLDQVEAKLGQSLESKGKETAA